MIITNPLSITIIVNKYRKAAKTKRILFPIPPLPFFVASNLIVCIRPLEIIES